MLPPGHIHHRQLGLGSQNLTPPRQPSALLSLDHAPWTEAKARLLPEAARAPDVRNRMERAPLGTPDGSNASPGPKADGPETM